MSTIPDPERDEREAEGLVRQAGRGLLVAMYAALRALKLYPVENAAVQKALDDLMAAVRGLLETEKEIEIRLAGDFIFVNQTRLRLELDSYASFSQILAVFRAFGIGSLRVHPGVQRKDWQALLSIVLSVGGRADEAHERFGELARRLGDAAVTMLELDPEQDGADSHDEAQRARELAKRTYAQGVAVTKEVMTSARLGRGRSLKKVKRAVQLIVDQVLNNETSIVGLTTLRDYDDYTFTHSLNVCIFAVALGKKLGFSRLQLYDLGLTALLHDIGKARIPLEVLNKTSSLDEQEWRLMQRHPWLGTLALFTMRGYDEIPYRPILVAHEHHMKIDMTGYPRVRRPRTIGLFSRIVAVADGFDAATTRRAYQTVPIEPDQVLREMWDNPRRGYDRTIVKALINLTGVYPVGTVVILDSYEVAVVAGTAREGAPLNRPLVRIAIGADGSMLAPPGEPADLNEKLGDGNFRRSIVKVTNPDRYGLTVGDYFV